MRGVVAFLAAFLALSACVFPALAEGSGTLTIETDAGPVEFSVEYASSAPERSKGLMFRRSMASDHGMLFDFGEERRITMWMRNTYISLDMLFADASGTIVHIAQRTEPFSEEVIEASQDARYVLEINGGIARKLGINRGDRMLVPAD